MNKWIRRIHRWLGFAFTVTVIVNIVVMSVGQGEEGEMPPPWVTYSPLLPLGRFHSLDRLPQAAETRMKRIETACDMLAKGKRRPCCFDRSGMYAKSLSCPVADD